MYAPRKWCIMLQADNRFVNFQNLDKITLKSTISITISLKALLKTKN